MLFVFKTRNWKKKLPNFYLFKQNMLEQIQTISELKTHNLITYLNSYIWTKKLKKNAINNFFILSQKKKSC